MIFAWVDEASLDRLHDIAAPPPSPLWPPAPGWFVLGAVALIAGGVLVWRLVLIWKRNRHRWAGLAELKALESRGQAPETVRLLAELVKRVALVSFGRERVAALSGDAWLAFLDASEGTSAFTAGAGDTLESGYGPSPPAASPELFAAVRHWITHHRAGFRC
jgi:hypothetical protein